MFQEFGSDHLSILLTVPFSSISYFNKRPFNFQETRLDDFAYFFKPRDKR